MNWSMGETQDLAIRASKGAGLPWGLAEEASFAVAWLEQRNLPGVEALAKYLESIGQPNDYHAGFCPIGNGSWISDSGNWLGSFPLEVRQPLLLAPFIAQVVKNKTLNLAWAQNLLHISNNDAHIAAQSTLLGHALESCTLAVSDATFTEAKHSERIRDDREPWMTVLLEFAQRTYAPASEMSRLLGAGAGLNDND